MSAPDQILYNPLDPAVRADPYPAYARLRSQAPVYEAPTGAWLLSRYADCAALLKDDRASSDPHYSDAYRRAVQRGAATFEQEALGRAPPFLLRDPPDHTRLRGLVSKAFTPKVVEGLRPRIQRLVDGLLDRAAERGSLELIEEVAYPLPLTVICELLGVPAEDHESFKRWSAALARAHDPEETLPPEAVEQRRLAGNAFADYFRRLVAQRRTSPREDLLSALIAAEEAGDRLTEDELVSTCIFLLAAGHETTVNLIGNGALALLRHPDQLQKLRENPSLARGAVEEFLRYDAPVHLAFRFARESIALGGQSIPAGAAIVLLLASANRDPDRFADPDRLDITRPDSHHLAFGFGVHFCLGAPLARVEGEIAFRTLTQRVEGLALDTETPQYKENIVLRGLRTLPVRFASIAPAGHGAH